MFSNPTFPYAFFWGNKNINSMWSHNDVFYFKTKDDKIFVNWKEISEPNEPTIVEVPKEYSEYIDQPTSRAKSGRK